MNRIADNTTFSSNIHFVDRKTFDKIAKGLEINQALPSKRIGKADEFYTKDVRTCTAGGFVFDKSPSTPVGFHFLNYIENLWNSQQLVSDVVSKFDSKPKNGLLFGSKIFDYYSASTNRQYSVPLFDALRNGFSAVVENLSLFESHKKLTAQTHYYYNKATDTHYLCAESFEKENKSKSVTNLKGLLAFYKNISIAKTDKLFIKDKEISKDQAPHIFAA
jgi:hypothetical protein